MTNDQEMTDASAGAEVNGVGEEIVHEKQRLRLLPGSTATAASFAFEKEDHTLGNALRYLIMKNPDVEFCGYSIPHPSEPFMNLRIQTWDDVPAVDVLRKGLQDLADMCDVVEEKFTAARDEFNATHPDRTIREEEAHDQEQPSTTKGYRLYDRGARLKTPQMISLSPGCAFERLEKKNGVRLQES